MQRCFKNLIFTIYHLHVSEKNKTKTGGKYNYLGKADPIIFRRK